MNLPKELEFERLTAEQKLSKAVPGYMRRIRGLYDAVYERFGEDGLHLIREVSSNYGAQIGANLNRKGGLKGLTEVGRYLIRVFDIVGGDWEVTEFSENRLIIAVHRCPFPLEKPEICQAHTCMEKTLVATLDDALQYRIGCSIPGGDEYCEHILEKKPPVSTEPS
jgi:hypothetical protein